MRTCPCGFVSEHTPWSAAWHRDHREHHLIKFPAVDQRTRDNLQTLIEMAERRELAPSEAVAS